MRNTTGNPVEGSNFFGRFHELCQLKQSVSDGNHVLLVGPRRVGKSSLVVELKRRLLEEQWEYVHVDVQHATDEAAFLYEIQQAISRSGVQTSLLASLTETIARFRRFLRGKTSIAGFSIEIQGEEADWEEAANALKDLVIELSQGEQRVLIAIDELPIFLDKLLKTEGGDDRVRGILDWLRSVRQACSVRLPWVLCGSIGLDTFVARQRLEGCINDLQTQTVDAFEDAQAVELLETLGRTADYACPVSKELAIYIIHRIGWPSPNYLQLFFHALKSLPDGQRSDDFPSPPDVDAAYQSLLSTNQNTCFGHWESRLGDLLNTESKGRVETLLTYLCEHPTGRTEDELFEVLAVQQPDADPVVLLRQLRNSLEFLERDGYLGQRKNFYAFRSFLLRDYWKRKFGRCDSQGRL